MSKKLPTSRRTRSSIAKNKAPSPARIQVLESESQVAIPEDGTVQKTFPIVGIGASAGGLEAFTQVLRALPPDTGMAFVLVQHLSPKHESMLTELLQGASKMRVSEVRDGMKVQPNHVYVIPPNTNMGILNRVLHLVPRPESRSQVLPIDFFFRSLAEEQKGRAIGVILSGTASDGAIGLKSIKAEGGITLAQDPKNAKYDGMPRAAISAGVVDFVLSAEQIASELAKIGRHPYVSYSKAATAAEIPEAEEQLNKVFFLLRSVSGVDFTYYKHATIKRRIKRRMVLNKIERVADYVLYLQHNSAEVEHLYHDILIHVTGFFRDPQTFEALKNVVFPEVVKHTKQDSGIRIWVPGCSTGEETYSIAIALLEHLGSAASSNGIQIFATDVSLPAIEKARAGFYAESIASEISSERLRRYFAKADGGYRISKSIRDICVFAKQDVTKDPPFSKLDLISCRNVLIYLGSILQRRTMSTFHYALKPTGYLLLGGSETIGPFADLFSLVDKKHKIYAKKSVAKRVNLDFSADYAAERPEPGRRDSAYRPQHDLQDEVDSILLERYSPAGVLISNDLQIVHVRGQTGRYLEPAPGDASLNVLKMAREGLRVDLRTAIHSCRKTNVPVRKEGLRVKQNGKTGIVNIEIVPVQVHPGERHFLILFKDVVEAEEKKRIPPHRGLRGKVGGKHESLRTRHLEEELTATREYLQSIIQDQEATNEELQSANEEILSSNEEMQSTNEELETAKEELQSTNEELNTVNEELQTRNQELSQVNSDLTNLLTSVFIPIIMVGNDLRIRRFTPMAEKLFNLIPGDLGRPIGDIKPNINVPNLDGLITETIDSVSARELDVQDVGGRWYRMRLRPYKSLDHKIDGAVLALLDIGMQRVSDRMQELAEYAGKSADFCGGSLLVLDQDLKVLHANDQFAKAFGLAAHDLQGRNIFELDGGRWNRPEFRNLLEKRLERETKVEGFEFEQQDDGLPRQKLNALVLGGSIDRAHLIFLSLGEPGIRRSK